MTTFAATAIRRALGALSLCEPPRPVPADKPARKQILAAYRPCETAPNGTGRRCRCEFRCANFALRGGGYGA